MEIDDGERAEVAAALRGAVERSGLTQANFARHVATSATRLSTYLSGTTVPSAVIYLRILRVGDAFDQVHRAGLMTPGGTATSIDRALEAGDEDFALRMILQARDDLRSNPEEGEELRRVWAQRARPVADERFDALLRTIVAHELGDDAPSWAVGARLERDWVVPDPFREAEAIRAETPDWLAAARIFIAERGLVTV